METNKIWTWNWVGGGYNSCLAKSRDEAVKLAIELGTPKWEGRVVLVPDLKTFKAVTPAEMNEIDRHWAPYFD